MDEANLPEFEIFRAGTQTAVDGTKVTVTPEQLSEIASGYDPQAGEAPLVLGHPKLNAPAYGWVDKLRVVGNTLMAAPKQVDLAFAGMVNDGRYKKRSAAFFLPDSAGNPTPGKLYLRHVGFLGAAVPGVPGLRDVSFAAEDKVVEFAMARPIWGFSFIADLFSRLRDNIIERDGLEQADKVLPDYQINSVREAAEASDDSHGPLRFGAPDPKAQTEDDGQPEPASTDADSATAEFAARQAKIDEREQSIAARETALRDRESHAKREAVVEFAAGLVRTGHLLPRQQAGVVELLVALDSEPTTLSFAAADGSDSEQASGDFFRGFLGELPVQVDMTERSAGEEVSSAVEFAAPAGAVADKNQLELLAKARAYQAKNPSISFVDAVKAVGGH